VEEMRRDWNRRSVRGRRAGSMHAAGPAEVRRGVVTEPAGFDF
jgi:hypothetical protein